MSRGAVASVNNCARRGEGVGARSVAQVASGDTEWDLGDKEDETEAGWGRGRACISMRLPDSPIPTYSGRLKRAGLTSVT